MRFRRRKKISKSGWFVRSDCRHVMYGKPGTLIPEQLPPCGACDAMAWDWGDEALRTDLLLSRL